MCRRVAPTSDHPARRARGRTRRLGRAIRIPPPAPRRLRTTAHYPALEPGLGGTGALGANPARLRAEALRRAVWMVGVGGFEPPGALDEDASRSRGRTPRAFEGAVAPSGVATPSRSARAAPPTPRMSGVHGRA